MDISFMRSQYPADAAGPVDLVVGGPRVAADLGVGEVDTYSFEAPAAATHIITTIGSTDTVVTLHGPGDPGTVMAWDDDRGAGHNAAHRAQAAARDVLALRAAQGPGRRRRVRDRRQDPQALSAAASRDSAQEVMYRDASRWHSSAEPRAQPRSTRCVPRWPRSARPSSSTARWRRNSESRLRPLDGDPTPDPHVEKLSAKVAELDARVTAVSTELANQLTELGHDIDSLGARPPADAIGRPPPSASSATGRCASPTNRPATRWPSARTSPASPTSSSARADHPPASSRSKAWSINALAASTFSW